ncbi:hypothetical protein [uncultured Gilvimarinus sp.]|uniref:hypothetical protein n=1 Tax=uncultured Gilvimarinus sp. TaxID=1689143 RepID=UPI0030EDA40A
MIRSSILALLLTSNAFAVEVIAVVDLKFLKDTGETASTLCFKEETETESCATWATFYLFEARVKTVVHGEPISRKFKVWFGQHALKKGNIQKVVAKLKPLPAEHEASYQITALGERQELYCFHVNEDRQSNVRIEPRSVEMRCYEPD